LREEVILAVTMKYYHAVSRLNGLLLDLENSGNKPVPRLVPWKRNGTPSQLWYDDPNTGTIRNKANNYCIDIEADLVIAKPFQEGDHNQQWERHENTIRNRRSHKVLDILGGNTEPGAEIGHYKSLDNLNQSWDFEFIDENPWGSAEPGKDPSINSRRFYIVSEWNKLVVDIAGADRDEGAKIITWPKNDDVQRNQLWYLDQHGYIRSDFNDMVFSSDEAGDKLKMTRSSNDSRSQWVPDKKKIVNRTGEILDIRGAKEGKGANLCAYQYSGAENQHWHIQYV
jgi:hypothetical protein